MTVVLTTRTNIIYRAPVGSSICLVDWPRPAAFGFSSSSFLTFCLPFRSAEKKGYFAWRGIQLINWPKNSTRLNSWTGFCVRFASVWGRSSSSSSEDDFTTISRSLFVVRYRWPVLWNPNADITRHCKNLLNTFLSFDVARRSDLAPNQIWNRNYPRLIVDIVGVEISRSTYGFFFILFFYRTDSYRDNLLLARLLHSLI